MTKYFTQFTKYLQFYYKLKNMSPKNEQKDTLIMSMYRPFTGLFYRNLIQELILQTKKKENNSVKIKHIVPKPNNFKEQSTIESKLGNLASVEFHKLKGN